MLQPEQVLKVGVNHTEQAKLRRTGTKAKTVSLSSKQSRSNFARGLSRVHMSPKVLLHERQISKTLTTRSRDETDQLRALTAGSLGQLLDCRSKTRADAECDLNGQSNKITALDEEASNLQLLLKESEKQPTPHQYELWAQLWRMRDLTTEQPSFHSQLSGSRAQLAEQISACCQLCQDPPARCHEGLIGL